MKYELKSKALPREKVNKVCINCGKKKSTTVAVYPGGIRPNTTMLLDRSLTRAGSWLGCKVGNHRWYFEYELRAM